MQIQGRLRFYVTSSRTRASLLVDDAFWTADYNTIEDALTVLLLAEVVTFDDSARFLAAAQTGARLVRSVAVPIAKLSQCGFIETSPEHLAGDKGNPLGYADSPLYSSLGSR